MALKPINTPQFRAGFISIFKATVPPGSGPETKPTYSIRALFPPTTDFTEMKALVNAALRAKWGADVPKGAIDTAKALFTRTNADLEKPYDDVPKDWIVINFKAQEKFKPAVVDAKRNDIFDEADVYGGAWYRAHIDAYGYDARGNKGVAFGLLAVQKTKDDDAIGRGAVKASSVFESFGDDDPDTDSLLA